MKDYLQKIKSWYEAMKTKNVSYEKKSLQPVRDWKIMLTVTFIILCFLAVLSFYFYLKVDSGEMFAISKDRISKDTEINTTLLKKIVGEINSREDFINKLKGGGFVPSDPSI